ncbi:MAG: hypothetical protein IJJ04_01065 [Clostridia bacterium]|nr:hypothetical protein [Clostridia bacterium]
MWNSIIVISIFGTLGHFIYEMSGHNKFIALFAAVNESTWEHIKIALTPSLLWGLYDGFIYGEKPNYFAAKSLSLLAIIILIPLTFYAYKAVLKKTFLALDVIIFYISIICSQFVFKYFINLPPMGFIFEYLGTILLFGIFACYMVFTLQPPKNFIFEDPISKKYGKEGHTDN